MGDEVISGFYEEPEEPALAPQQQQYAQQNQSFQQPQQFYAPQGQANQQQYSQPQFTQPQQPQQTQRQPQQQQQQQQGYGQQQQFASPFPFPGNDLMQGAVGAMAAQQFQSFHQNVSSQVSGYVNVGQLQYYFKVDSNYVRNKLGLLLFPYMHKDWNRVRKDEKFCTPREDVNAPDLYIPAMAIVTYILAVGLALGTADKFTPEAFGLTSSSTLGWLIFEVVVYKMITYLLAIDAHSIFELIAYTSYKFVGVVLAMITYLMSHSTTALYVTAGVAALGITFFTRVNFKPFL